MIFRLLDISRFVVIVANVVALNVIMVNWRNNRDLGATSIRTAAPGWGVSTNGVGLVRTLQ